MAATCLCMEDRVGLRKAWHLQIAKAQLEQDGRVHHRLTSPKSRNKPLYKKAGEHHKDNNGRVVAASPRKKLAVTSPTASGPQATSVAAEVAAKLTANSSSAAVLTSVLSSLAAEGGVPSPNGGRSQEKRPRVESRQAEVVPGTPDPTPYCRPWIRYPHLIATF